MQSNGCDHSRQGGNDQNQEKKVNSNRNDEANTKAKRKKALECMGHLNALHKVQGAILVQMEQNI